MKKLAIGVSSIAVLVIAGSFASSYYIGGRVQQGLEDAAKALSAEEGLQVDIVDYQRGIAQSQAQTRWTMAHGEEAYHFTVKHDIVHGPWPMGNAAKVVSRLELPEHFNAQLAQAFQQQAPMTWTAIAHWDGSTAHTLVSPSLNTTLEDGTAVQWGGLNAEWTLSAQHNAMQGFAKLPLLDLHSPEAGDRLQLQQLELSFDATKPDTYQIWLGPSALKIGSLALQETSNNVSVQLQDIDLQTSTSMQGPLLNMGFNSKIGKLQASGTDINHVELDLQIDRINARWMDEFSTMLSTTTPESLGEEQADALLHSLPMLLTDKPVIAIPRLALTTPQGTVQMSARAAYVGQQPTSFDPSTDLEINVRAELPQALAQEWVAPKVRRDYMELLESLQQELDATQMQAAVEDGVAKRIAHLLELGAMQTQGSNFVTELDFTQGEIRLNKQPQSLQQLLSLGSAL